MTGAEQIYLYVAAIGFGTITGFVTAIVLYTMGKN